MVANTAVYCTSCTVIASTDLTMKLYFLGFFKGNIRARWKLIAQLHHEGRPELKSLSVTWRNCLYFYSSEYTTGSTLAVHQHQFKHLGGKTSRGITEHFALNKENNHVMTRSRCLMSEEKKHNNIEPILEGRWSCETRHRENDFLKPVTLVPITNGKGTSSGKSLNLLNSLTWKWNQQTHFSDSHLWDWNL